MLTGLLWGAVEFLGAGLLGAAKLMGGLFGFGGKKAKEAKNQTASEEPQELTEKDDLK